MGRKQVKFKVIHSPTLEGNRESKKKTGKPTIEHKILPFRYTLIPSFSPTQVLLHCLKNVFKNPQSKLSYQILQYLRIKCSNHCSVRVLKFSTNKA